MTTVTAVVAGTLTQHPSLRALAMAVTDRPDLTRHHLVAALNATRKALGEDPDDVERIAVLLWADAVLREAAMQYARHN